MNDVIQRSVMRGKKRVATVGGVTKLVAADVPEAPPQFRPLDVAALAASSSPPVDPVQAFGPWAPVLDECSAVGNSAFAYVAGAHLACGAAAIGGSVRVRVWEGYSEPLILKVANIGKSSTRKSPGMVAFQHALGVVQADEHREHAVAMAQWNVKAELAEKAGGKASGKPAKPYLVVQDATVEKLCVLMAARPRGMLLLLDELGVLLGGFGRYKSGAGQADRAFYNTAYQGSPYSVHRISRDTVDLECAALSVVGNATPDIIKGLTGDGGGSDGLAERFLYLWPDPRPYAAPSIVRPPFAPAAEHRLAGAYRRLATLPSSYSMGLEPSAFYQYDRWRGAEQEALTGVTSGLMSGFVGKTGGTCARIAGVLELLDWAARTDESGPPANVSEGCVIRAITIVRWCWDHMRRVLADTNQPSEDEHVTALASYIRDHRLDQFNARDLRRDARIPGLRTAGAMNAACDELVTMGWISPVAREGWQSNRATDYAVNPLSFGTRLAQVWHR